MSTQTDFKRKAAAHKGQATRLESEADRARKDERIAEARLGAARQRLYASAYEAGRAFDASLGAGLAARDRIGAAVRPLTRPIELADGIGADARRALGRFETRGARARDRASRDAGKAVREVRERLPV